MLVVALVSVGCFAVGVVASARWLPELGTGPVAGLTFFVICGLLAVALSLAGVHAYSIVHAIERVTDPAAKEELLASGLRSVLFECGTLVALTGILYLLAPGLDEEPVAGPAALVPEESQG